MCNSLKVGSTALQVVVLRKYWRESNSGVSRFSYRVTDWL